MKLLEMVSGQFPLGFFFFFFLESRGSIQCMNDFFTKLKILNYCRQCGRGRGETMTFICSFKEFSVSTIYSPNSL